jgi:hypothetical protein
MNSRFIDTPSGTLAVRFISSYYCCADYGVTRCGAGNWEETRISLDEHGQPKPKDSARMVRDYGVTFDDAAGAVLAFKRQEFDAGVRYLSERGLLEHACDKAKARAVELGLAPAAA